MYLFSCLIRKSHVILFSTCTLCYSDLPRPHNLLLISVFFLLRHLLYEIYQKFLLDNLSKTFVTIEIKKKLILNLKSSW